MIWRALSLFALATIMVMSCAKHTDYLSQNLSEGWTYGDPVLYELERTQEDVTQLDLLIDHDVDYTYQNLYLRIDFLDQHIVYSDTISVQLADDEGYWKSDCYSGACQLSYTYPLTEVSKISAISVTQFSREQMLNGINQIGLNLR